MEIASTPSASRNDTRGGLSGEERLYKSACVCVLPCSFRNTSGKKIAVTPYHTVIEWLRFYPTNSPSGAACFSVS